MPRRYMGGYISSSKLVTTPYLLDAVSGVFSLTEVEQLKASDKWAYYPYYPPGQIEYTTPGTYTFIPSLPYNAAVVCIGAGGGGAGGSSGSGGGLGWKNNIQLTAGTPYTVVVGLSATATAGTASYFDSPALVSGNGGALASPGKTGFVGDGGGGGGGSNSAGAGCGGGGAGGYSGNGGNGTSTNGGAGAGGGAGGGGGGLTSSQFGGGGGGVGIYGEGFSGPGGLRSNTPSPGLSGYQGGGGSGGTGNPTVRTRAAGSFGGGAGSSGSNRPAATRNNVGQPGAVRIIWGLPGLRSFPTQNTQDM